MISAGHCFKDQTLYIKEAREHPERFAILPLTLDVLNQEPSESKEGLLDVSSITVHPGFQFTPSAPFEIKDDVAVVTLRKKSSSKTIGFGPSIYSEDSCWTVIWEVQGEKETNAKKYFLRERSLGHVENQACQTSYSSMATFNEKFICANNLSSQEFAVSLLFCEWRSYEPDKFLTPLTQFTIF